MKLIKSLALAAVTAVLTVAPALADSKDEYDLIQTAKEAGILVSVNGDKCTQRPVYGVYTFVGMKRMLTLCPGAEVDPHDRRTVKHEVWHAIQHCVNTARGTDVRYPVNMDTDSFVSDINTHLSEERVNFIKASYPEDHWLVEFEAALAEQLPNETIDELFRMACIY